ncbi:hypothetical protein [Nonomuraea jabiensis]|uniref:hypothetical protein n=1 Tax=Nonomuraea jabiensis TaxID=882448 RepID=UPI003D72A5FF
MSSTTNPGTRTRTEIIQTVYNPDGSKTVTRTVTESTTAVTTTKVPASADSDTGGW